MGAQAEPSRAQLVEQIKIAEASCKAMMIAQSRMPQNPTGNKRGLLQGPLEAMQKRLNDLRARLAALDERAKPRPMRITDEALLHSVSLECVVQNAIYIVDYVLNRISNDTT